MAPKINIFICGLYHHLKKNLKIYQHSAQGQLPFDNMLLVTFR